MDLGLRGRRALVCGGSRGLGRACARALAIEGVAVTIAARRPGPLSETADVIGRESGATTTTVAADVTTDAGQAAMLAVCPDPDIIVTNAGGPPHGEFEDWTWDDWLTVANDQMLSPIMLIRATIDAMIARKFGRIVVITSRTVRMPVARLGLSSGARSGLTGFLAGLARDVARHNVTINFILPGPFQTDRFENNLDNAAARTGEDREAIRAQHVAATPAGRLGNPDEVGAACAYLCGIRSGYITGQNLLIDGGGFPGTL